jgi:hypothetical protein
VVLPAKVWWSTEGSADGQGAGSPGRGRPVVTGGRKRIWRCPAVAEVARELGVGWATLRSAVVDYGTPLVEDPDRIASVQQLGLDEAKYQKAGPRRHTRYATACLQSMNLHVLPPCEHGGRGLPSPACRAWSPTA